MEWLSSEACSRVLGQVLCTRWLCSDVSKAVLPLLKPVFLFQLEKLIEKNYFLHKSAQEAYKSYTRAYDSHFLKQIFNVSNLNLPQVALSFGFKVPPFVDLSILLCVEMSS